MKHSILFTLLILCGFLTVDSQSVAINNDGSTADTSAILDVKSTAKGLLIPRMTTAQRTVIATPGLGLMVYDTDTNTFWCYTGSSWVEIMQGYVTLLNDADDDTKIQVEESADEDIIRFDMAGTEYFRMDSGRLEILNTGESVFLGEGSGVNDDFTDNKNVFVGYQVGNSNTTGHSNTAIGRRALYLNTTGNFNTAVGRSALLWDSKYLHRPGH